ncbi:MAG: Na/Pi cotransporter family protein [Deferrisomatales bacterium]
MWVTIGTLAGGLGLFLLAVAMITDGLKLAAGSALRDILARYTSTPMRGVASGALVTGLVQSSSAVTVATIGFVNAGLLELGQALGVLYGAAIGTTATGWLVAAVGFQLQISTLAYPLVGAGMLARLLGPSTRAGAIGEAAAGFGLFFLGIDVLRAAFGDVAGPLDFASLSPKGPLGLAGFLGVGFLMTLFTQSSSAAVALTLTAATTGIVDLTGGGAMIIGATVATTSTSALAAIGATPNARRVAAAHVGINSANAATGFVLLPSFLWLLSVTGDPLGLRQSPALALAGFHTAFTVAGVLLQWPANRRMTRFLSRRFLTPGEQLGRPQYLDANVLFSPVLAVDAFALELRRMAELAGSHVRATLGAEAASRRTLTEQREGLLRLVRAVERFVGQLEAERITQAVAKQLPLVLRISNYLAEVADLAREIQEGSADVEALRETPLRTEIDAYRGAVLAFLLRCDPGAPGFRSEEVQADYESLRKGWRNLKTALLEAGVRRLVPVGRLTPAFDALRAMLRIAERYARVTSRMAELKGALPGAEAEAAPPQTADGAS